MSASLIVYLQACLVEFFHKAVVIPTAESDGGHGLSELLGHQGEFDGFRGIRVERADSSQQMSGC